MDLRKIMDQLNVILEGEVKTGTQLNEAEEPSKEMKKDEPEDTKIRVTMGFERLLGLLFTEEDSKIGRIALRKILNGDEAKLTLRERGAVANALIKLVPAIASDRTLFNRIERTLSNPMK